jgi:hypothetical protein
MVIKERAIASNTIRVGTNQKLECNESHSLANLAYFIDSIATAFSG